MTVGCLCSAVLDFDISSVMNFRRFDLAVFQTVVEEVFTL